MTTEPRTLPIIAEYPPPSAGEKITTSDAEKKEVEGASASVTSDRTVLSRQGSKPGVIHVLDASGSSLLLEIDLSAVGHQTVGWLQQQVLAKRGIQLGPGDQMMMYTKFGSWLKEDDVLGKVLDPDHPRVFFYRRVPHEGPFMLNMRPMAPRFENQVISIPVLDSDTIRLLKERICEKEKFAVAHQRIRFQGELLDDQHTVGFYRLPAEATLELDVVPM